MEGNQSLNELLESGVPGHSYDELSEVCEKYAYLTEFYDQQKPRKKKFSKNKVDMKLANKSKMKKLILDESIENKKTESKYLAESICRYTPRVKKIQLTREFEKLNLILDHLERKRENTEKMLKRKGLKRQNTQYQNTKMTQPKNIDAHILTSTTNSSNPFKDNSVSQFLIDLQFRDISPEDYEYLLQLDDSIQQKVASKGSIANLPVPESIDDDSICVICFDHILDKYCALLLPKCKHVFHKDCITTWLSEISDKCPIDNVLV